MLAPSQISLEQRITYWPGMENTILWPLPLVHIPKNGRIQSEMGQWRPELRFCVSQVRESSSLCHHAVTDEVLQVRYYGFLA